MIKEKDPKMIKILITIIFIVALIFYASLSVASDADDQMELFDLKGRENESE